ncbi:MAG: carbonic anhydrase [Cyanobacteria bacterium K_Offshore_surface_m2_011]|nr:carbonic anhydrase [Cyanobacteria bacterium K_Offshore_surface_m2_011]
MAHSRRHLLRLLALAGAGVALDTLGPRPAAAETAAKTDGTLVERLSVCHPGGDPLQELLRRNRDFCKAWQGAERSADPLSRATLLLETWPMHCQVRPDALAAGQRPWASVLCCADSRVAPEWIFACGAGELFEVRSAGNTAFDAGVASLEYAVGELAVPLILVMGHSGCGAVTAAMASNPLTPLLEELVAPIRASLEPGADLAQAVRRNARAAAAALPQRSALLRQAVAEGRLTIQAAYFDIGSGEVSLV